MIRFASTLQLHWDWRAAGNFVLGGAGSALLALMAASSLVSGDIPPLLLLVPLAFVGAGLGCVWLEIGRPWRALNAFRHPQLSWMTREAIVATLAFVLGLGAAVTGSKLLLIGAGLTGLGFLYCQGRILKAAKGVPAWREPAIVPLIIATGFAEACGLLALLVAVSTVGPAWLPWAPAWLPWLAGTPAWLPWALAALALLRVPVWRHYRSRLEKSQAPAAAQARLARLDRLTGSTGLVAAALAVAAAFSPAPASAALLALAGATVVVGGWTIKFVIVTGAAHLQGYAFGRLRHGHPLAAAAKHPNNRKK